MVNGNTNSEKMNDWWLSSRCHYKKIIQHSGRTYKLLFFTCFIFVIFVIHILQEFTFNYSGSDKTSGTISKHLGTTQDDWRRFSDNIHVYSAFWDTRFARSFIRIIGGIRTNNMTNLPDCLIKYNHSSNYTVVPSKIQIMDEHHNKISKGVYIICTSQYKPNYVALVPVNWNGEMPEHWLNVHSLQNQASLSSIGICVRPMFNFTDVFRIVEFIAYYEALGVEHFMFYNYSISEDIYSYLRALKKENYSIHLYPWSLPYEQSSMWMLGQLASINDCMYRGMGHLSYIIIADLDEFITPTHVLTLHEFLEIHDVPKHPSASFIIRNCFFCAEYEQDVLPPVIPPFLTQISIRREKYIYPFHLRSKYIIKPQRVEVAGIHMTWKLLPGWDEHLLPASEVLVHHYRGGICRLENKSHEVGEIDVMSRKYLNQLMRSRAVNLWKSIYTN